MIDSVAIKKAFELVAEHGFKAINRYKGCLEEERSS